jgi:hypothetical protein
MLSPHITYLTVVPHFSAFPLLSTVAKARGSPVTFLNPPVRHGIVSQRIQISLSLKKMGAICSYRSTESNSKP